jgi:hypothetical protein
VLTGVQGFTLQIRRPAYNRPGRIRRPAYVTNATDLKAVGDLGGAGVEKLSYVSSERLLVGVRSFGADDTGWMTTEGEVVLGRLDSNEGAAAFFFPRLSFDKWFVVR